MFAELGTPSRKSANALPVSPGWFGSAVKLGPKLKEPAGAPKICVKLRWTLLKSTPALKVCDPRMKVTLSSH